MLWDENYEDEHDFPEEYALAEWASVRLAQLPDRCGLAVALYFGVDPRGPMTYKELGVALSRQDSPGRPVSADRARELVARGLRALRSPEMTDEFRRDSCAPPDPEWLFLPIPPRPALPKLIPPHVRAAKCRQARAFNRHTRSTACSQTDT